MKKKLAEPWWDVYRHPITGFVGNQRVHKEQALYETIKYSNSYPILDETKIRN